MLFLWCLYTRCSCAPEVSFVQPSTPLKLDCQIDPTGDSPLRIEDIDRKFSYKTLNSCGFPKPLVSSTTLWSSYEMRWQPQKPKTPMFKYQGGLGHFPFERRTKMIGKSHSSYTFSVNQIAALQPPLMTFVRSS